MKFTSSSTARRSTPLLASTVNRMGYGAMRITGPGIWGDPPDPDSCRARPLLSCPPRGQQGQVFVIETEARGRDVLHEVLGRVRPGDHEHDGRLVEQPGKRDLR